MFAIEVSFLQVGFIKDELFISQNFSIAMNKNSKVKVIHTHTLFF